MAPARMIAATAPNPGALTQVPITYIVPDPPPNPILGARESGAVPVSWWGATLPSTSTRNGSSVSSTDLESIRALGRVISTNPSLDAAISMTSEPSWGLVRMAWMAPPLLIR